MNQMGIPKKFYKNDTGRSLTCFTVCSMLNATHEFISVIQMMVHSDSQTG